MEASASVLATRPVAAAPAPTVTFRPSPAEAAVRLPHFAPEIIAHHQPDHPVSAQYRDLLVALTPEISRDGAKALLFAPGVPDADAAVVLLNLAVTAVRQGNGRIVIVDADPRQSALANRLGLAAMC
jgi:Mrp family chromosome partitioning ATPase